MKKITFLLSIFCLTYTIATAQLQTYDLDTTFGNEGIVETNIDFLPTDVKLINDYYFFTSSKVLSKVDYNGNIDTSFGDNGFIEFGSDENPYYISGFKYINNSIYVYGGTNLYNENDQDFYIAKLDEAGNFDTEFGTNGIAVIDFNYEENLKDFTIDESGKLFCLGTSDDKMTYFKIMPNGNLDMSFGTNGFKDFSFLDSSSGFSIKHYNGNYLLTGGYHYYDGSFFNHFLLLTSVDENGDIITSFGENGYITASTEGSLKWAELIGDSLYVSIYFSWSFSAQGYKLLKYDLTNLSTEFNNNLLWNGSSDVGVNIIIEAHNKIYNEKIYTTGYSRCDSSSPNYCEMDFILQRRNLDGGLDGTFASYDGGYSYDFEHNDVLYSYDRSSVFEIDETGKILIGGYTNSKFSMIRIQEGALNTDTFSLNNKDKVYPNPFTDYVVIENIKEIPAHIEVTDVSGRIICKPLYTKEGESIRLDLSLITQKGVYIVKSSYEDKTVFNKIIKE